MRLPAARRALHQTSLLSNSTRQSFASTLRSSILSQYQARHETTAAPSAPQHAVSNPTLANIEKRWETMPPQEQAELWMALRDRMTANWHELTMQEKRASYWIAFGPHGPRAEPDPNEKYYILRLIFYCLVASGIISWSLHHFAGPPPKTMTKEWQEMTNEYLRAQKSEPITGLSSEGYTGKGMVQSKPSGKKPGEDEEEDE